MGDNQSPQQNNTPNHIDSQVDSVVRPSNANKNPLKITNKHSINKNIEDIPTDVLLQKEKALDTEINDEVEKVKLT